MIICNPCLVCNEKFTIPDHSKNNHICPFCIIKELIANQKSLPKDVAKLIEDNFEDLI